MRLQLLILLFLAIPTQSFLSPSFDSTDFLVTLNTERVSSTAKFGLRTFVKKRFAGWLPKHSRRKRKRNEDSQIVPEYERSVAQPIDASESSPEYLSSSSYGEEEEYAISKKEPISATALLNTDENSTPPTNSRYDSDRLYNNLSNLSSQALYSLPPLDHELTELGQEFRQILSDFTQYTARDILCLRDYRTRVLCEGVIASADEPLVYRAFEILFEDLYPLRVAGRIVAKKLFNVIEESIQDHEREVAEVTETTGLAQKDVEGARLGFLSVAIPLNGKPYFTVDQLLKTAIASTIVDTLGFDNPRVFLERINSQTSGRLQFSELMVGLHKCAEELCALEDCNAAQTIHKIVVDLVEFPSALPSEKDAKRQRYSDRYDDMVHAFRQWEGRIPENSPDMGRRQERIMEVVQGCFRGAENKYVVNALRILYTDYSGLRVAGDLIFGIVSKLMKDR
ncbi:hypothetical protein FisN_4Lh465 [Fistulifera solaris]|uniref:Uncharacterized protein n=1 Tax=Fistulifera solaris TaxID=1519565 RepID=A0A1Z5KDI2_FISSO|nr:hypothetical protein FisN_4Lh465 [Fistulifera solaris]|eukprot:GAX24344.1 hypothetical protein FisN_4Lh465 [Fistulifera solaris]